MLRLQHSLLEQWFLTDFGAFYASPLISNDFVGNPFRPIVGARMPAAPPNGRANPPAAQTPLRQRPKRACRVNRFTLQAVFRRFGRALSAAAAPRRAMAQAALEARVLARYEPCGCPHGACRDPDHFESTEDAADACKFAEKLDFAFPEEF